MVFQISWGEVEGNQNEAPTHNGVLSADFVMGWVDQKRKKKGGRLGKVKKLKGPKSSREEMNGPISTNEQILECWTRRTNRPKKDGVPSKKFKEVGSKLK